VAGNVLVVMSSAKHLDLREGKKYPTGFYLNEFAIPFRKLVEAGYTPVIANPNGDRPLMDANSNNPMFFGGDDALRAEALKYVEGLDILNRPKKLADVAKEDLSGYVGLFIPGGHAPVQDLSRDRNLGEILRAFHSAGKPTGILCHGPLVLLSTLSDSEASRKLFLTGPALLTAWQKVGRTLVTASPFFQPGKSSSWKMLAHSAASSSTTRRLVWPRPALMWIR
jgi:putative intracellular protease/amidase